MKTRITQFFIKARGAVLAIAALALPAVVMAQSRTTQDLDGSLETVAGLLGMLVKVLIALAVIYFIVGVIEYITADDEDKKKKARDRMIYGIIGIFVIVSIWGLVAILRNTFDLDTNEQAVQVNIF
ncbi:MAG: putative membrane-anchored protein [Flavobacteriaceae bacterium]|jgi:uncharacterized membrane-anchored protein